jgi:penicillin amidase
MRRVLGIAALLVLLGSTAPSTAAAGPRGPNHLPGLLDAASVARDRNGIAHITARNDHDLYFLQGWVHAQDRLFQMDVSRRTPSGTLAEMLGPGALPSDVQLRTLGLRRAAARSIPVLSDGTRAALQAYADGVNAWVTGHALPPEYATLGLTSFEPWTPLDTVTIGKAIAFQLSFDVDIQNTLDYLRYVGTGAALGFDGNALFYDDAFRSAPFSDASTVPDATAAVASAHAPTGVSGATPQDTLDPDAVRLARGWLQRIEKVPFLARVLDEGSRAGSNEWGVAGSRSASGFPMVANDPHLALDMPSTFYPIHLRDGSMDVYGEGFAGAPGVILGHNRFVAWGATTNPMDVTDTYQEQIVPDPSSPSGLSTIYQGQPEHVVAIPETYRANVGGHLVVIPPSAQIPPATLIVPRRNQGPIVSLDQSTGTALSIQYTGFSPTRELDSFFVWDRARNLSDFERGLEFFDVGSQNWAYADVRGNLAYFTSAEMPLREDLEAGHVNGLPPWFIRNGTGGDEWLPATHSYPGQALPYEILPPEEMPHVVNPPAGFFVNANNDPAGTTLDNDPLNQLRPTGGIYYLNPGYDGFRAGRITEMVRERLADGGRISFAGMQAMQSDVALIDAEVFVPAVQRAFERARSSSVPELAALAADPRVAEAVGRLAAWDFTTPTGIPEGYDASDVHGQLSSPSAQEIEDSVAATIYALWRSRALVNTIDATLGSLGLPSPGSEQSLAALRHLLDTFDQHHGIGASGLDFFAVPGVADPADRRDILLLRSLQEGLDRLSSPAFAPAFGGSTNQVDYRWGRLHRIVFDHPLGGIWSVPPAGGAFPQPLTGLPGVPTDGGFETVDVGNHSVRAFDVNAFMFGSGPNRRFVGQLAPGRTRAVSALPGGTSGEVGDPHYVDLLPDWLTDEAYPQPLRWSVLQKTFVMVDRFVP